MAELHVAGDAGVYTVRRGITGTVFNARVPLLSASVFGSLPQGRCDVPDTYFLDTKCARDDIIQDYASA